MPIAKGMQLTEDEKAAVLFLADRYRQSRGEVDIDEIPGMKSLGPMEAQSFVNQLCRRGFAERSSDGFVSALPPTMEVAHDIEHPPVANQWNRLIQWWFASWWRTAIAAIAVILPLLVQWIQMIRTILAWCGLIAIR